MKLQFFNKHVLLIIFFPLLLSLNLPAFADKNYHMEIDNYFFDIKYEFDGNVIAMGIDKELNSLLIGTENVKNSQFEIAFPPSLLSAENNEFAILVNGIEVEYQVESSDEVHLTFFIPTYTEEIEIIGTHVIPEYPLGITLILLSLMSFTILFQKTKRVLFR
ncbi:MAG TPA: hypothetical protein VD731_01605 [Nitrosopumilaceae archaeon]|nr:hypothetical protein [Nitrosopumilaceae archaeon]